MNRLFLLPAVLVAATAAFAQAPQAPQAPQVITDSSLCGRIRNSAVVIECMAALILPRTGGAGPPAYILETGALRNERGVVYASGNWDIAREADPITDHVRVSFGNTGIPEASLRQAPMIFLTCFERQLEFQYSPGDFVGLQGPVTRIRFDQTPAVTETWAPALNGMGAFAPNGRAFMERLLRHERMILETRSYQGNRYVATFDIRGLSDITSELVGCMRPAPRPNAAPRR